MKWVQSWSCLLALCCILPPVSQAQDTACLSQLVPCLQFINSNKTPSRSCCDPLKSLVRSDPRCLCDMLGGNSAAQQAGVNMTRAQLLPVKCGEKVTATSCTSSPKTKKTTLTSSAEKLLILNAVMVAVLAIMVHSIWVSTVSYS